MDPVAFLVSEPLLTLFLVAGFGFLLGKASIAGARLGPAAVLFVGLAVGALSPEFREFPALIYQLGLILFVYSIGISAGPGFAAALRGALKPNLAAAGVLLAAGAAAWLAARALGWDALTAAGLYAGSLTNTPALAAVIESSGGEGQAAVVAYSVAYPMGVTGVILAMALFGRMRPKEADKPEPVVATRTLRITHPEAIGRTVSELDHMLGQHVVFSRVRTAEHTHLAGGEDVLREGDLATIVGEPGALEAAAQLLGEDAPQGLELDRSDLDFRRIFVSAGQAVGRPLRELHLPHRLGALITRVRRGDVDFLPTGATVLEYGDRVRVVAPRGRMAEATRYFGDSYRSLSELDVLSFGLAIGLGLLLGAVPIPLPGGLEFRLGLAGGPLAAALVLGAVHRTGPILWSIPYSASLTIRQFGLIIFLAAVGLRSGDAFVQAMASGQGLPLFLAGAGLTFASAMAFLLTAQAVTKLSSGTLMGMVSGVHTQPAALGFAQGRRQDEEPSLGYAAVFPLATLVKIVAAQILLQSLASG
jgi:putative transport protein